MNEWSSKACSYGLLKSYNISFEYYKIIIYYAYYNLSIMCFIDIRYYYISVLFLSVSVSHMEKGERGRDEGGVR